MSLFHPPAGFPPHLAYFWPLIWCQVLLLRAAVRNAYGQGVLYHWSVSPNGRVFLTSIDWMPSQKAEREWLAPAVHASDRLAAACNGPAAAPVYAQFCEQSSPDRVRPANAAFWQTCAENLPLPDT